MHIHLSQELARKRTATHVAALRLGISYQTGDDLPLPKSIDDDRLVARYRHVDVL